MSINYVAGYKGIYNIYMCDVFGKELKSIKSELTLVLKIHNTVNTEMHQQNGNNHLTLHPQRFLI